MKKIFTIAALACCAMSMHAEDLIGVVPGTISGAGKSMALNMMLYHDSYKNNITQLSFEAYPADGITVTSATLFTNAGNILPYQQEEDWDNPDENGDLPGIKNTLVATIATKNHQNEAVRYFSGVVSNNTKVPYKSENGQFARLIVKAEAGTPDGYYPIVLKCRAGLDTGAPLNLGTVVTYVKVGNPTNAELALEGVVPSFVNDVLAAETGVASLDLEKVTALNGEFVYTVGKAITAPALTADVKVAAPLPGAGKYGSLKSPVALPGVKCYTYSKVEGNTVVFAEATSVPANETVIIDADVDATVNGATLASVANTTATAGDYYIAPDGSELRKATNTPKVPALRGTWSIGGGGSNLRIALDTPTGIKMIGTADEVFGNTYDLQGRQVQNAQNGVYVVNGKKQIVK